MEISNKEDILLVFILQELMRELRIIYETLNKYTIAQFDYQVF